MHDIPAICKNVNAVSVCDKSVYLQKFSRYNANYISQRLILHNLREHLGLYSVLNKPNQNFTKIPFLYLYISLVYLHYIITTTFISY